jgi:hypothetical protein
LQAPHSSRRRYTSIPKPSAPNAIYVADGQIVAGTVVPAEGTYVTFTPDGVVVGEYLTLKAATDALPDADVLGECESIVARSS